MSTGSFLSCGHRPHCVLCTSLCRPQISLRETRCCPPRTRPLQEKFIRKEREQQQGGREAYRWGRRPRPQPQEQWQQADGASSTRMTRTATRNRLSHKARHVLILSHSDAFFLPVTFVSAFLKMASKMCGFGHKRAQKIYFFRKFLIAIMSSLRIRAARTDFQDARLRG